MTNPWNNTHGTVLQRMPDEDGYYLVRLWWPPRGYGMGGCTTTILRFDRGTWLMETSSSTEIDVSGRVLFWAPLPDPPPEEAAERQNKALLEWRDEAHIWL